MQITAGFTTACSCFTLLTMTVSTSADVLLFDLAQGREAWEAALVKYGLVMEDSYDLTAQWGDPGIAVMDGPVGIGNGDKELDSNLNPWGIGGRAGRGAGGTGLNIVGTSAGFGNPETAIPANYFVDSLDILNSKEDMAAAEFSLVTFLSDEKTVDLTVYSAINEETVIGQFFQLDAPTEGHRYGILTAE